MLTLHARDYKSCMNAFISFSAGGKYVMSRLFFFYGGSTRLDSLSKVCKETVVKKILTACTWNSDHTYYVTMLCNII